MMFIDAAEVMAGLLSASDIVEFATAHSAQTPIISSSVEPGSLSDLQRRLGATALAERLDQLFADAARLLIDAGVRRLIVAGGETSGAVASALGRSGALIGPEIAPGVPILFVLGKPPLALVLKSGNFGTDDFFARALELLDA